MARPTMIMKAFALLQTIATAVGGLLILLAVWWIVAENTSSAQVPKPWEAVMTIYDTFYDIKQLRYIYYSSGGLWDNLIYTIVNVITSVFIGSACGMIFGVFIARNPAVASLAEPPLLLIGTFPVVALLPFFTMWFGTDRVAQYGLVLVYSFITVALVARQATYNIGGYFGDYAASLGSDRHFFETRVILPAIVPEIIGAVRISFAAGWGFETVAEILGAPSGAGRLIQVYSVAVMTAEIFGVLLCMGVIAVLTDALIAAAGRWVTRWKD